MHDIRFIRENPDAFDEGLRERGLEPLSRELIALDEARRARHRRAAGGAGAAQRALEGDRAGEGEEGRGARAGADGRGGAA